jgi:hypothetical protein
MKPVPMPPSGAPELIARLEGIATPIALAVAPGRPAVVTWKGAAIAPGVVDRAAPALAATPKKPRRDVFRLTPILGFEYSGTKTPILPVSFSDRE